MTANALKFIALVTMIIDHVGAIFFPELIWLRIIGRISFPLFAFLLVQGFTHTSNKAKYALRLGLFALLSEVPYDMLFSGNYMDWSNQSIMFELFCGIFALLFLETAIKKKNPFYILGVLAVLAVSMFGFLSYDIYGICLMLCFYLLRNFRGADALALVALTYLFNGIMDFSVGVGGMQWWVLSESPIQMYAVAAVVPLVFYNGKKGKHSLKWLFYFAYPVHLLVLWGVRYIMENQSFVVLLSNG